MREELRLLVVGGEPTADALAATDDFVVDSVGHEAVADRVTTEYDGLVVVGQPRLPETAVAATRAAGVPVVAYTESPPTAAWLSGFVRRTDDPDATEASDELGPGLRHLADELRLAADGETRLQLRAHRRQLATLHDGVAELATVRSVEELCDRALAVAGDVLTFDTALLLVRDGSRLRTVATAPEGEWAPETEPLTGSLAGDTLTADAPRLVDDVREDDRVTTTGETVTVVSVPVGDDAVLQVGASVPNAFTTADLEVAQLLGTHVGETRERLLAEADARSRRERITGLHRAATDLIDVDTAPELYELTVDIAADVLRFDGCTVAEATDGGFLVRADASGHAPVDELLDDREGSVMDRTHRTGESIVVDDVRSDDRAVPVSDSYRSGVSVAFGDDGVFQAVSAEPNAYDETDLELAELLVSYASTTLERIESETALREARETTERLHEAATRIAAADDEATVIDRAMTAARDVLAFDISTIDLVDESGERLLPAAVSDPEVVESEPTDVDEGGLAGKSYRTGESIVADDLAADADADPTRQAYRSAISVPIGDVGVFQAGATETDAFDDGDVGRAELLFSHVAVSLERVRAEAGLRDERDRLSALFENIPDAVVSFEMTPAGPIVRQVNEAFEETFGYEAATLADENLDEFLTPETGAVRDDATQLNERLRAGENVRHEGRRETSSGVRDFLMYVVPLELGTENVAGYAIYSDITERKERERELRRQNERLDEFASVVSHDLRNPISIADGWLDMARRSGEAEHFDRVQEAIDRMEALVEDLLTLAREGEVVGDAEPVELAAVAECAWDHVDTAQATLDTGDATGVSLEADGDRLTELFENLYRNAVEHAGTDVAVRIAETETGFVVEDDGPGVPADRRETVFDAGVTRSDDGTGFGLPIVRRIAEAHGWSVTLRESWAGGAAFAFDTA